MQFSPLPPFLRIPSPNLIPSSVAYYTVCCSSPMSPMDLDLLQQPSFPALISPSQPPIPAGIPRKHSSQDREAGKLTTDLHTSLSPDPLPAQHLRLCSRPPAAALPPLFSHCSGSERSSTLLLPTKHPL